MRRCSLRWAVCCAMLALCGGRVAHAAVIGSFDLARGGEESLAESPGMAAYRAAIGAAVPGTTFASAPVLTDEFLATVDFVYLNVKRSETTVISPLSAAEQTALHGFVLSGGAAVLLGEAADIVAPNPDAVYESLFDPFGVDITGSVVSPSTVTIVDATNPITNGPFGLVGGLSINRSGWFDSLGPYGQTLATLDANGQPVLAWLPRGAMGTGSGAVLLLADSSVLRETQLGGAGQQLLGNGLAYLLVPEPSAGILFAVGASCLVAAMRRRRRAA